MSIRTAVTFLAISVSMAAQSGLVNGNFDEGAPGGLPTGWTAPQSSQAYTVSWIDQGCQQGKGCVETAPGPDAGTTPGNIMQSFDAAPYHGKLVRYRAAVNGDLAGRVGMWLRVDLPGGRIGFFDNMQSRPIITQGKWQYFEIDGFVDAEASRISLGFLDYGGKARYDDATFEITGSVPPSVQEPARPLTAAGLRNLTAFTKLYGYVRHFHPSDEVEATDWNRFAIEGVRKVEAAATPADLAASLQAVFAPVAPTLRVFTGSEPKAHAALTSPGGGEAIYWRNRGVQFTPQNVYRSERIRGPLTLFNSESILNVDLGSGVKALVPIVLFADARGTLPHGEHPIEKQVPVPAAAFSGNDRATRLADIVITWNVMKHFYPYFDVAKTDWDGLLPANLQEAAADADADEFNTTLMKLIAQLKDGHGSVRFSSGKPQGRAPLLAEWMENRYIVLAAAAVVANDVKAGDEIVAINGKPALSVLEEQEKLISGATSQWRRARANAAALIGPRGEKMLLTLRSPGAKETREVAVVCNSTEVFPTDPRPKSVVAELAAGIWYVDLTRASDKDIDAAMSNLTAAKGIVFDMRGYPHVGVGWFSHVSKTPLRSAQFQVPVMDRPGHITYDRGGEWNLQPLEPYWGGKKVFLTNGTAISYAESTMGIIEAYKLGEIVGEPTAGTNGNVNPFDLPGGYTVTWTGMRVMKHDGSQHHGVGILPTVRAARTQAGVAAGRDEVLERGLAILK